MTEEEHFMTCPICGGKFDIRDLGQVFSHLHEESATVDPEAFKRIRSRRVGDQEEWWGGEPVNLN